MNHLTYKTTTQFILLLAQILPEYKIKPITIINKTVASIGGDSLNFVQDNEEIPVLEIRDITTDILIDLLASRDDKPPKILWQENPAYPVKTIGQSFLRGITESGRIIDDLEGVVLELIELIKTNYKIYEK